jgi:hypothetical protein
MFEIDLGVSVFCNLIGWYFYHPVGFKKGREADGEEVALYLEVDYKVKREDWVSTVNLCRHTNKWVVDGVNQLYTKKTQMKDTSLFLKLSCIKFNLSDALSLMQHVVFISQPLYFAFRKV